MKIWKPKKEDIYPIIFIGMGLASMVYLAVKIVSHFRK